MLKVLDVRHKSHTEKTSERRETIPTSKGRGKPVMVEVPDTGSRQGVPGCKPNCETMVA